MTGGAPLHPDLNALDLHVLVERRSEIIVLVLVLVRCGETHKYRNTHRDKHINSAQMHVGVMWEKRVTNKGKLMVLTYDPF